MRGDQMRGTTPIQGKITGTVRFDKDGIGIRRENVKRGNARDFYKGVGNDASFTVQQYDLILGTRDMESTYMEVGFSSISGLNMKNREVDEKNTYFIGFAAATKADREEDFTAIKAGTVSLKNNGTQIIYAGDLVAYKFPSEAEIGRMRGRVDGKVVPLYVPFNVNEVNVQGSVIKNAISSQDANHGIAQFTFEDYMDGADDMSTAQEEAAGLVFGEVLKAARVIESKLGRQAALEFLRDSGIFNPRERSNDQNEQLKAMTDLLIVGSKVEDADNVVPDDLVAIDNAYKKYGPMGPQIAQRARDAAFLARASKIVGTAMNTAPVGAKLDLLAGHTKVAN